jgi:UDP-2,3-diacylglucosamine hydrolase
MKSTLFLSDLHLAPAYPRATAALHALCAGPARDAAAVYILGDLFDWWVGDDQLRNPDVAAIAQSLASLAPAGVPLFIGHGNRDFLLGERFAAAAGARLLPESLVVDLYGTPTLLSHGDEMCTDDVDYQRFRARARDPALQKRLLRLPYFARLAAARWLRRKSSAATALKPEAIMDVNADAVADAFRAHDVRRMIHGHTHRPARHEHVVDGIPRERLVLADWHDQGHYLEVDEHGAHARDFTG